MKVPMLTLLSMLSFLSIHAQEPVFEDPLAEASKDALPFNGDDTLSIELIQHDGRFGHYQLKHEYGEERVVGRDMLLIRLHELNALRALDGVPPQAAAEQGADEALAKPLEGAEDLLTSTETSLENIPRGANRGFHRWGMMFRGGRGAFEDPYSNELMGQGMRKRRIAASYAVDPYTTNPELKRRLDLLAWNHWAAAALVDTVMDAVAENNLSDDGYTVYQVLNSIQHFNEIMADTSPEDLMGHNRRRLRDMGIAKKTRNTFTRHHWLSPLHETIIVDALGQMGPMDGKRHLLQLAMTGRSEMAGFKSQRLAQLTAHITGEASVELISRLGNQLVLHETTRLLIPIYADKLMMTPQNLEVITRIQEAYPNQEIEVWSGGGVSDAYLAELQRRNIHIVTLHDAPGATPLTTINGG